MLASVANPAPLRGIYLFPPIYTRKLVRAPFRNLYLLLELITEHCDYELFKLAVRCPRLGRMPAFSGGEEIAPIPADAEQSPMQSDGASLPSAQRMNLNVALLAWPL
jgi:hypothetical protein